MVLESLVGLHALKRHSLLMLFLAAVLSSVGIWISYLTFPKSSSVLSIAFVTVALMPIIHRILVREETAEAEHPGFAASFIARHFYIVKLYAFFFIGLILCYSLWYTVLPTGMRETVFSEQEGALGQIQELKSALTGNLTLRTSACGNNILCWFEVIFFTNSIVMALAVVFSFIYGAGAIFLIGWNASVIGVFIGRSIIAEIPQYIGFGWIGIALAYLHGLYNSLGLVPHGMFESLGYFVAAIAGGIISAAISKRRFKKHEILIIAKDAAFLIVIASALLGIGALIESYAIIASFA